MQTLQVTPTRIIFHRDDFCIYATQEDYSLKGDVLDRPEILIGQEMTFYGDFDDNERHGKTFIFHRYEFPGGDLFFFLTTIAKGISVKLAKSIIAKFGQSLGDVITKDPQALLLVSGIKEKKLHNIVHAWNEYGHLRKLSEYLGPYDISNALINRIYNAWGDKAIHYLQTSPYKLTDIRGIGFKKADEIARTMGRDVHDPERIKACLLFCFDKYMSDKGHSAIHQTPLWHGFLEEITLHDDPWIPTYDDFIKALDELSHLNKIISLPNHKDYFSTQKLYAMECFIHEKITLTQRHISQPLFIEEITSLITDLEDSYGYTFGTAQKEAIHLANANHKIFAIAGYAGSGKTTTSKAILELYQRHGTLPEHIICCALSGVASNRIKQQSGYLSCTIHSLLKFDGIGFQQHDSNLLDYDVILLDEASMVDVEMFYHLLKAINFDTTTLILLGDPAQLPPVGAGNIFTDLLTLNLIPCITLDKIYRQSEDKAIVTIANEIRQCHVPTLSTNTYSDFFFVNRSIPHYFHQKNTLSAQEFKQLRDLNAQEILNAIIEMGKRSKNKMNELLEHDVWSYITYFQVLSPMRDHILGTHNLNKELQKIFNPSHSHDGANIAERHFYIHDKVIHLSNKNMETLPQSLWTTYQTTHDDELFEERRVFNGQLGIIVTIDNEENRIIVYYPNEGYYGIYTFKDFALRVIDLAYAMTIHKAQGSEFANVIMPITFSHFIMLHAKLLYTAITRAKEKFCFVGEDYAFKAGCKKADKEVRLTTLSMKAMPC